MKKTLMTLAVLAMAAVASAETSWTNLDGVTLSYDEQMVEDSTTYNVDAFSFDFCITSNALAEGSSILAYVSGEYDAPGGTAQITFILEKLEDSYTLWTKQTNLATDVSSINEINSASSIKNLQENVVYTLSATPMTGTYGSSDLQVSVSGSDGSTLSKRITGGNYIYLPGDVTAASIPAPAAAMNSAFAASALPEQPSQAAPEPTTATLSLLALAGLAARRRRK